jgi:hypothetical protein
MTRYFYDCEFIENGCVIDLISIGIACEDGREYYAQHSDFIASEANEWVKENVFPHLYLCHGSYGEIANPSYPNVDHFGIGNCRYENCPWRTRLQIRDEVLAFVNAGEGEPEFYGYYSAYDHVALCQLFGKMIDLPKDWPMYTRDLKQWCDQLGCHELPPQEENEHNALADARYNKSIWSFLNVCEDLHNNYGVKFRK